MTFRTFLSTSAKIPITRDQFDLDNQNRIDRIDLIRNHYENPPWAPSQT